MPLCLPGNKCQKCCCCSAAAGFTMRQSASYQGHMCRVYPRLKHSLIDSVGEDNALQIGPQGSPGPRRRRYWVCQYSRPGGSSFSWPFRWRSGIKLAANFRSATIPAPVAQTRLQGWPPIFHRICCRLPSDGSSCVGVVDPDGESCGRNPGRCK